jgi:DNA-binding MarR family transcriptional regulator
MPAKPSATEASSILVQMERDLAAIRRALRTPFEEEAARAAMTVPQTAIMQTVFRHPGMTLKDLSREVSLAHSTVSGIVDRLEKRGLLERRLDPADGRVSRIHTTAVVSRFVRDRIPELHRGPLGRALGNASLSERKKIAWALQRLRTLLEDLQSGA